MNKETMKYDLSLMKKLHIYRQFIDFPTYLLPMQRIFFYNIRNSLLIIKKPVRIMKYFTTQTPISDHRIINLCVYT